MVSGSRSQQPFTEYWTFTRSGAARTKAGETAEIAHAIPDASGSSSDAYER